MHPLYNFALRLFRLWNNLRQMSWGVMFIGGVFIMFGALGVINGPLPYPDIHILNSTLMEIHQKLATDFVNIGLTVFFIDFANRWRDVQQEKRELIRHLKSRLNEDCIRSIETLSARGWLRDGSLRDINLTAANLQEAPLDEANLMEGYLLRVSLVRASLIMADLQGAVFEWADLQGANLDRADLQGAFLVRANLQGAILTNANMKNANLGGANLQGTILRGATFDESTILPDKTNWTSGADLSRFIDPGHPNFWRGYDFYGKQFIPEVDFESANHRLTSRRNIDFPGATLSWINLQGTYLPAANFQKTELQCANLRNAYLQKANFKGANLDGANLQGADLSGVELDKHTILPDGTHGAPDTDLARFTDPNHPNFWPAPACSGKKSPPHKTPSSEKRPQKQKKKGD